MEKNSKKIIEILRKNKQTMSTMESCTGGLLASTITNEEGSSEILKIGFVTYSNEYKIKYGVKKQVIDAYTVYSIETAREMARATSVNANSNWGIGITGQIGRIDPANQGGKQNLVYYTIYYADTQKYYDYELHLEEDTRMHKKEKIVEEIIENFKNLIEEETK